ncbi:SoxR reducing system RseC family protein [Aquisalimonas sp.]|uniref:SoxR reducing system RseC family protein n=1 Tax=unclassified Aquisalimonas TaxID=2644645 RepID=UPI0025BD68C2|nr:SoxR reducing system RseC family protein [Aquisalimonas sp.]
MIREQGQVVATGSDRCRVRIQRHGACSGCDIRRGCGIGLLASAVPGRTAEITCQTGLALRPGQRVEVGIPEQGLVSGAAVVYLLPVLALLVAALLGSPWGDAIAVPAAGTGFVIGLVAARALARRMSDRGAYRPTVLGNWPAQGDSRNE